MEITNNGLFCQRIINFSWITSDILQKKISVTPGNGSNSQIEPKPKCHEVWAYISQIKILKKVR